MSWSSFCYVLFGVGAYVLLVGILGVVMSGRRSRACVTLWSVAFFALIALHAAIVAGFLFYERDTIDLLKRLNTKGDNGSIQSYFEDHKHAFKIGAIVTLSVEFVTFCLAVCFGERVAGRQTLDEALGVESRIGLIGAEAQFGVETVSHTPATDERRRQLNEKYGGLFEKRRSERDYMRI